MPLKLPDSMDDIIYWTNRAIGKGTAMVWVPKQSCPTCKKATMGKPVDETGKVKIRAKEYVCPACKYTVEKQAYEETLTANALYTCPSCLKKGEFSGLFKRKNVEGVLTFRFPCGSCRANIDVTKKMKEKKKKGKEDVGDDE
jgi:ssDNA-binding Zn-finger/Zn-ribbon topoisomerase 1